MAQDAEFAVRDFLHAKGFAAYTASVVESLRDEHIAQDEWLTYLERLEEQKSLDPYIKAVDAQLMQGKLRAMPLFEGITDDKFIKILARSLEPRAVRAGEDVISVGDANPTEMFFLRTGEVEVIVGQRVVASLGGGAYFGEAALLSSTPRNATIRTVVDCDIYALSKQALHNTFARFPAVEQVMRQRRDEIESDLTRNDLHRLDLQQWLNTKSLGNYTAAVVDSFNAAEYPPAQWLPELVAMDKDGSLESYAKSVKKHYTPQGERDEDTFMQTAAAKLSNVPLFKPVASNAEFLKELGEKLQLVSMPAGSIVIRKGDIGDKMYFIHSGELRVLETFETQPIATLHKGTYFGEDAIINAEPRNAWVQAVTKVELFTLSKEGLEKVLVEFPQVEEAMQVSSEGRAQSFAKFAAQDSMEITFTETGPLGLSFGSDSVDGTPWIKTIKSGSQAAGHKDLKPRLYLHSVAGRHVKDFQSAMNSIKGARRPLTLSFGKRPYESPADKRRRLREEGQRKREAERKQRDAQRQADRAAKLAKREEERALKLAKQTAERQPHVLSRSSGTGSQRAQKAELSPTKKDAEQSGDAWPVGMKIDVDTEDGWIYDAVILGPSKGGDSTERRIEFADGDTDDWHTSFFRAAMWHKGFPAGLMVDVDTEDGLEHGVVVIGPADSGDNKQRKIKFVDGVIDDWDTDDFHEPQAKDRTHDANGTGAPQNSGAVHVQGQARKQDAIQNSSTSTLIADEQDNGAAHAHPVASFDVTQNADQDMHQNTDLHVSEAINTGKPAATHACRGEQPSDSATHVDDELDLLEEQIAQLGATDQPSEQSSTEWKPRLRQAGAHTYTEGSSIDKTNVIDATNTGNISATFKIAGKTGIKFVQDRSCGDILIERINPGSQAAALPQLEPGLCLKMVQQNPIEGRAFSDVIAMIKAASRPITLQFAAQSSHTIATRPSEGSVNMHTHDTQETSKTVKVLQQQIEQQRVLASKQQREIERLQRTLDARDTELAELKAAAKQVLSAPDSSAQIKQLTSCLQAKDIELKEARTAAAECAGAVLIAEQAVAQVVYLENVIAQTKAAENGISLPTSTAEEGVPFDGFHSTMSTPGRPVEDVQLATNDAENDIRIWLQRRGMVQYFPEIIASLQRLDLNRCEWIGKLEALNEVQLRKFLSQLPFRVAK